jgi:hypothetical protein
MAFFAMEGGCPPQSYTPCFQLALSGDGHTACLSGGIRSVCWPCMIPDPLEGASDEDKVQVAWHKFGVHGGPRNKLFAEVTRYGSSLSLSLSVRASS